MSDKAPRILIVGATFETNNMGVSALAAAAVKCAVSSYPDAQVAFLDYGKEKKTYKVRCNDVEVLVPLINIRFSKKIYLANNVAFLIFLANLIRLVPSRRLRERLIEKNETLAEIYRADLVAGICGGDSFSDIYGLTRLIYIILPLMLVNAMRRKLVLLPQTYGPFRGKISRVLAGHIIGSAKQTYARDHSSRALIDSLMHSQDVMFNHNFCYDLGFVLDPYPPDKFKAARTDFLKQTGTVRVGLNVSGLLWMGGYRRNNMFGLKSDYKRTILALIESFMAMPNVKMLLIPHVLGAEPDSESDSVVCEQLFDMLQTKYASRVEMVRGNLNQSEIKYVIGRCDFFIGSRMHACIAAMSQCVPAVPIAYSDKFSGVMETLGKEILVLDARKITSREIVSAVLACYRHRGEMRDLLLNKMPDVRARVMSIFRELIEPPIMESKDEDRRGSDSVGEVELHQA